MSIDTHWFSTLFGWYVFSGIWISGTIAILLLIFFLKGKGYLEFVKDSHIHDFGEWLFAGSVLWSYLFFSQFMLIWYADIPEEVTYYVARFIDYKFILWSVFAINLILPLVFLMSREAMRSRQTIMIFVTTKPQTPHDLTSRYLTNVMPRDTSFEPTNWLVFG